MEDQICDHRNDMEIDRLEDYGLKKKDKSPFKSKIKGGFLAFQLLACALVIGLFIANCIRADLQGGFVAVPVVKAIDTTGYNIVKMNVSAYCPCSLCCDDQADGITASGWPAKGFLVAAPPEYPFGTKMRIPGYSGGKEVIVRDRGGAIKGNKVDLLFATHQEALNWGRQHVMVEVWTP